jgi:hypothetical protein
VLETLAFSCHTTILAHPRILYGRLTGPFMNKGNTNDMDHYEEIMVWILFLSECTMKFTMNFKLQFKMNFKLKCFTGFCHYGYVRKGGFQVWLCISTKWGCWQHTMVME